ncbi:XRE family transcriptional regulator [uncultured Tateyamaria sp.]|uniref:helix-turn-helix domain-containing protein n=1 Tax=uncultured Tateyamaria sp. TaxID=455651 RepID=UPI0026266732|nr:XRE family transcriptional regulator [uncultured Tateyamaria sp.]
MDIKPIRTEEDYDWALAEIAPYFDEVPAKGTAEADRFDVLADLISAYEAKNHPMEALNPVDFIATFMEEKGLQQGDFAVVVGSVSRASEFLNRKRPLTLSAVQKIHQEWRLPASVLIQPYHLEEDNAPQQAAVG